MTTTTDPFDPLYLDEVDLRGALTEAFVAVLGETGPATGGPERGIDPAWHPAVVAAMAGTGTGNVATLSASAQDRIVDAWAAHISAGRLVQAVRPGRAVRVDDLDDTGIVALVRRALQVRVRNDGLTRAQRVDRIFAGRRDPRARWLVRSFGTMAGRGSCTCLDVPIVEGWQCCGSPWLDNGDLERFIRRARRNVALLDEAVRTGRARPIGDPVCWSIVTNDYPNYVGGPTTSVVARAFDD